jgi:hypothetical protein
LKKKEPRYWYYQYDGGTYFCKPGGHHVVAMYKKENNSLQVDVGMGETVYLSPHMSDLDEIAEFIYEFRMKKGLE